LQKAKKDFRVGTQQVAAPERETATLLNMRVFSLCLRAADFAPGEHRRYAYAFHSAIH
jgi:hypothetical protein